VEVAAALALMPLPIVVVKMAGRDVGDTGPMPETDWVSELVSSVASGVTVSGSLKMAQISAMARNVAGGRSVDGRSYDGALVWQPRYMTGW
jgi:hypothetical protein